MYRRRLRRTESGSPLHRETSELVEFLDAYAGNDLSMISFRSTGGGLRVFLADPEGERILFWMKMLDQ